MIESSIKIINGNYFRDGFTIIESKEIKENVDIIINEFNKFNSLFRNDKFKNRNILKRFSDCFAVNEFFSSKFLFKIVNQYCSIKVPVFCGPIFSHYTSHDQTGEGYGLPYHQDWPSMASSKNSIIIWFSLKDCDENSHSISVLRGHHKNGLLPGKQNEHGYEIEMSDDFLKFQETLSIKAGQVLLMSSFLPHKTYVNLKSKASKISLSRRIDDFASEEWSKRKYVNAYQNKVDRNLFLN
jgi:hypothetical protein